MTRQIDLVIPSAQRLISLCLSVPAGGPFPAPALRAVLDELEAVAADCPTLLPVAVSRVGALFLAAASTGTETDRDRAFGGLSVLSAVLDSELVRRT